MEDLSWLGAVLNLGELAIQYSNAVASVFRRGSAGVLLTHRLTLMPGFPRKIGPTRRQEDNRKHI